MTSTPEDALRSPRPIRLHRGLVTGYDRLRRTRGLDDAAGSGGTSTSQMRGPTAGRTDGASSAVVRWRRLREAYATGEATATRITAGAKDDRSKRASLTRGRRLATCMLDRFRAAHLHMNAPSRSRSHPNQDGAGLASETDRHNPSLSRSSSSGSRPRSRTALSRKFKEPGRQ